MNLQEHNYQTEDSGILIHASEKQNMRKAYI
jgi:hypothetical protein